MYTCFFSHSAAEVTVILANVSKYLTYVRSSVSYVQKHLNSVREPLEFVQVNILLKTCSAYEDIQRVRSIGKSGFIFSKSKSGFPNRTQNPKTDLTSEKSVLKVISN